MTDAQVAEICGTIVAVVAIACFTLHSVISRIYNENENEDRG